MKRVPLNEEIAIALSQLVDDVGNPRKPSHSDINTIVIRSELQNGDPTLNEEKLSIGKAKRTIAILNWALEYNQEAGEKFIGSMISTVRGHGGFREESPNFVGKEAIINLQNSLKSEGIKLYSDGTITPVVLDNLTDIEMENALWNYVRRAKKGALDAALLTGTSKDLLEAVSKHVIKRIQGEYSQSNFPTLLGLAFYLLNLSTPDSEGENKVTRRLEIGLYELGCSINALRNKVGTGHGHPFQPEISNDEAKTAIESMGIISEYLLNKLNDYLNK